MSMFKQVSVVSYNVSNWERSKKFYTEVLEWPTAFGAEEMGWLEFGHEHQPHIGLNLWNTEQGPMPPPSAGGAVLDVDDAHKVTAALRAKGVRCDDVMDIPNMVSLGAFYDPDGNRIQFAKDMAVQS
ncbi:MAG: VOC family protein [Chloroflexi bacterium]|nr:VOC family protein [Chloroflexota bacterium]